MTAPEIHANDLDGSTNDERCEIFVLGTQVTVIAYKGKAIESSKQAALELLEGSL